MKDTSEAASLGLIALILLALSFGILAIFTAVILVRMALYRRFKRSFLELHQRRVARARIALEGEAKEKEQVPALLPQAHSFSAWLKLGEDGAVTIAGQSFRPGGTFAATARDDNNIPRATAAGNGSGEVLINSHGQAFRAKFTAGSGWDVQIIQDDQP